MVAHSGLPIDILIPFSNILILFPCARQFFIGILQRYAEEYYENRYACQDKVEFHIAFIFGKDTENSAKQQVF
jgi:hypothetical protein